MKITWACAALVLIVAFAAALVLDQGTAYAAPAADKSLGGDKDLATKKGVSESLGSKEFDKSKLPGKWKISFAIGSVMAAIAALKWL